VDYPIKTLSQLRPILQGFRKAAGLTQAAMAGHLGVTQQTYAQLEANPAAVSVERLFKVLRVLQVDLQLAQSVGESSESGGVGDDAVPSPAAGTPADLTTAGRSAKTASSLAAGRAKRKIQASGKQEASAETQEHNRSRRSQTTAREAASKTPRVAAKPRNASKKRENW
jgi:HTH-type transcriptional regulator / antitoxin HipB